MLQIELEVLQVMKAQNYPNAKIEWKRKEGIFWSAKKCDIYDTSLTTRFDC